jgi:DNA polymerase-3 subunit gamma/tau
MSEQYVVSARKYRPQTFDTVVGQQHITTTLKNAIKTKHLAHAYLFCGPRGVGKTTCARILARTLNCEQPTPDMEACGTCSTCQSFQDNTSFNIFELDAASNNSVDDIRALTEQVRYSPQHGKYKIYIIDEVHMLSTAAFNAFLKTLEEPPSYAIFILATTEKHKILPTILSRCQIFDFKRIQTDDIVDHLNNICIKEHVEAENAGLHIIAQKSEGCMRDALSMMDRIASFTNGKLTYEQTVEHLNILDADVYFKLGDTLLAKDLGGSLLLLDDILRRGFEGDVFLNGFAEHFRNLLLSKEVRMAQLLDVAELHRRLYFEKTQLIGSSYILSALSLLNECELAYKSALNKRLHVELCLMRLCYLSDIIDTATSDDGLKKKLNSSVTVPAIEPPAKHLPTPSVTAHSSNTSNDSKAIISTDPNAPSYTNPIAAGSNSSMATVTHAAVDNTIKPPSPIQYTNSPTNTGISINHDGGKRPKLGKSLLKEIQLQSEQEAKFTKTMLTLSAEVADDLLKKYSQFLKEEAKQMSLSAQFDMMEIDVVSENALLLRCNSAVNHIYAQNQRALFTDFCKQKTGIPDLTIDTIIEDTDILEAPAPTALSKNQVYEMFLAQNAALKALKEQLNLQIE